MPHWHGPFASFSLPDVVASRARDPACPAPFAAKPSLVGHVQVADNSR